MSFKHIRNNYTGDEYDAPVSAIERWPEEFTVVDEATVEAPRPPIYFEQLATEPAKTAKKGDWEMHAQKLGVDTTGLTLPQIREAVETAKTSPAAHIAPVDAPPEQ